MAEQQSISLNREQLEAAGYGTLLEPGSANLPNGQMLMMDRIVNMDNFGGEHRRGVIDAELDVNPALWFFDYHFHEDPVMPGCLGLDALWQMLGFFLTWQGHKGKGRALGVDQVRFFGEITPDCKLVKYLLEVKRIIVRGATCVGLANGSLSVDGREIYTAQNLRVGIFPRNVGMGAV